MIKTFSYIISKSCKKVPQVPSHKPNRFFELSLNDTLHASYSFNYLISQLMSSPNLSRPQDSNSTLSLVLSKYFYQPYYTKSANFKRVLFKVIAVAKLEILLWNKHTFISRFSMTNNIIFPFLVLQTY